MANFNFDSVDFVRFAPVALRQCSKKGLLQELKKGSESSKYFYCLFGNLLYNFEHENDPSSALSLIFLESCTCKIVSIDSQPVLSIATVGGRSFNLVSCTGNREELQEWLESIENYKIKNMTRRLDDSESDLLQLQHRSQQHEQEHLEYEQSLVDLRRQLKDLNEKNSELLRRIAQLENEKEDVIRQMKSLDSERLLLLKSRGITPKTLPAWALQERPRKGVEEPMKYLKIWAGTWNLSGKEPFAGMQKDRAKRLLQPFVPDGYDLYVLGVQECISDSVFECLDALLLNEGCRRIKLEGTIQPEEIGSSDPTKIFGRGDGTLQSLKFTGIVIYARMNLLGDVKSCSIANIPFTNGKSKGAVAVSMTLFGRTVVFVNAHFDSKNNDLRRDQYQNLIMSLGGHLAEPGFHLNEQFNHLLWLGDFNFSLVDTSGNNMPPDTIINMLEDGRVLRTLFETHDQLNQDKKQQLVFYGYREPTPFPNFFPTYRKIENRSPVNYSSSEWVKNTYRTQVKESSSFFRGGSTKDIAPKFSDRILYCSMYDLAEDLVPEALPADMQVKGGEENSNSNTYSAANESRRVSSTRNRLDSNSGIDKNSAILSLRVDNYRSINDGEGMNASEHSPVFCTFLLRLRHDHGLLAQAVTSGDINNLLSALETTDSQFHKMEKVNSDQVESSSPPSNASSGATNQSDSVSAKTPASRRTWYTSKNNKSKERSTSPLKRKSSDDDFSPERDDNNMHAPISPSLPFVEKMSLLPHGVYRIRITDIKLIWGMMEESPINMSLLFPAPYEAIAGERFADFHSENCNNDDSQFVVGSYSGGNPAKGKGFGSPVKTNPNSIQQVTDKCWKRVGPSKTGTSLHLNIDRTTNNSCSEHNGSPHIPPLVLTWRGDEPLDRLHICLKATTQAKTIRSPMARNSSRIINGTNNNNSAILANGMTQILDINNNPVMVDADETITGHCSISLEQLCKVAVSGTTSVSTSAVRILVNRGRPMYNIDTNTYQREQVTFCCRMELVQT